MKSSSLVILIILIGCGGTSFDGDLASGINYDLTCPCAPRRGVSSGLAYLPDLMWSAPRLYVCLDSGTDEQKTWVREAIQRTWGDASALGLIWECGHAFPSQQVHIAIADHFDIAGLGAQVNLLLGGLTLGTLFDTEYDLRRQAVYGFGFVLGFTAEQDRADTPASCQTLHRFPSYAIRVLGAWDDRSVMNDCNPRQYNGGLLSEGDIAGAQRVYGEPPTCACW
jgi:hypothetical protein